MNEAIQPPAALLGRSKVQERTTLSRSSLYAMIARGDFPAPVKISGRRVAWPEATVNEWIQSRIDSSPTI
ncbi:AlpA family phage regulatory protein [Limnohabitans sp. DM1]|uniref:helix-turn-helix transcriptional regulator n=1 Tax=Limnohabitans sp. DM1 TaxID=1597955 RepID=UPI000A793C90